MPDGKLTEVLDKIRSYWGGMLTFGAVTFWEEYDPSVPEKNSMICTVITWERVPAMHGRQAQSISAKYFAGLDLVNKDGVTYILKPQMQYFTELDCTHFRWEAMELCVWSGMERFWKSHRMQMAEFWN